jgi:O-antigen/teichoic acid export membrane protein
MSRTDRAIGGVVTSTAATVVTALAGFVLVPIVLRYVTREEYGLWAAVGQAIGYLALLDLGVGSAVVRRTAVLRGAGDARAASRLLSTSVAMYCGLGAIFLVAGLGLAPAIPRILAIPASQTSLAVTLFISMVVYGAVSLPLRVSLKALVGWQEMARANLIVMIENVASPLTAVVLLASGIGLLALPFGAIAAGVIAASAAAIVLRRAVPSLHIGWRHVSRLEARELFTWSWLLGLNSLAVVVIYQTDNLVVAWGRGLAAATTYSLTSRLPLYAMPVIFALADSCLPAAIELCQSGRIDRLRDVYSRVMRLSLAAAVAAAIVAVSYNGPFMRLWVGGQNFGGQLLTLAFALILIYRVAMQSAAMVVIGTGRIRGVVIMSALEAALNLALSIWWVRRFGVAGVAAATLVAGVTTSAWYVTRVVCGELHAGTARYLWNGLGVPIACAAPAAAVAVLARRGLPLATWPELLIAIAATAGVYAATFALAGLTRAERDEAWARLRALGRAPQVATAP